MCPLSRNVNLVLKVSEVVLTQAAFIPPFHFNRTLKVAEVLLGDTTGSILAILKNEEIEVASPGSTVELLNVSIVMDHGYMRLVLNPWSSIKPLILPQHTQLMHVNLSRNLSNIEYQKVIL
uniref:Single-stranded DNA binding protein Ssb-like OB fold domain-containing protein n=1 Tax=Arcella intermedia TaxID=1963864 RepID=A0A6B2LRQ1_9EUKA